jgi:excisionase family DNA binding protein
MPYTIREAAQALGVSEMTIRRYIKAGKLKAELIPGTFGQVWQISDIQAINKKPYTVKGEPITSDIAQLHQEIGYWKARAMIAEDRLKLLESPRQSVIQRLIQRLFRH